MNYIGGILQSYVANSVMMAAVSNGKEDCVIKELKDKFKETGMYHYGLFTSGLVPKIVAAINKKSDNTEESSNWSFVIKNFIQENGAFLENVVESTLLNALNNLIQHTKDKHSLHDGDLKFFSYFAADILEIVGPDFAKIHETTVTIKDPEQRRMKVEEMLVGTSAKLLEIAMPNGNSDIMINGWITTIGSYVGHDIYELIKTEAVSDLLADIFCMIYKPQHPQGNDRPGAQLIKSLSSSIAEAVPGFFADVVKNKSSKIAEGVLDVFGIDVAKLPRLVGFVQDRIADVVSLDRRQQLGIPGNEIDPQLSDMVKDAAESYIAHVLTTLAGDEENMLVGIAKNISEAGEAIYGDKLSQLRELLNSAEDKKAEALKLLEPVVDELFAKCGLADDELAMKVKPHLPDVVYNFYLSDENPIDDHALLNNLRKLFIKPEDIKNIVDKEALVDSLVGSGLSEDALAASTGADAIVNAIAGAVDAGVATIVKKGKEAIKADPEAQHQIAALIAGKCTNKNASETDVNAVKELIDLHVNNGLQGVDPFVNQIVRNAVIWYLTKAAEATDSRFREDSHDHSLTYLPAELASKVFDILNRHIPKIYPLYISIKKIRDQEGSPEEKKRLERKLADYFLPAAREFILMTVKLKSPTIEAPEGFHQELIKCYMEGRVTDELVKLCVDLKMMNPALPEEYLELFHMSSGASFTLDHLQIAYTHPFDGYNMPSALKDIALDQLVNNTLPELFSGVFEGFTKPLQEKEAGKEVIEEIYKKIYDDSDVLKQKLQNIMDGAGALGHFIAKLIPNQMAINSEAIVGILAGVDIPKKCLEQLDGEMQEKCKELAARNIEVLAKRDGAYDSKVFDGVAEIASAIAVKAFANLTKKLDDVENNEVKHEVLLGMISLLTEYVEEINPTGSGAGQLENAEKGLKNPHPAIQVSLTDDDKITLVSHVLSDSLNLTDEQKLSIHSLIPLDLDTLTYTEKLKLGEILAATIAQMTERTAEEMDVYGKKLIQAIEKKNHERLVKHFCKPRAKQMLAVLGFNGPEDLPVHEAIQGELWKILEETAAPEIMAVVIKEMTSGASLNKMLLLLVNMIKHVTNNREFDRNNRDFTEEEISQIASTFGEYMKNCTGPKEGKMCPPPLFVEDTTFTIEKTETRKNNHFTIKFKDLNPGFRVTLERPSNLRRLEKALEKYGCVTFETVNSDEEMYNEKLGNMLVKLADMAPQTTFFMRFLRLDRIRSMTSAQVGRLMKEYIEQNNMNDLLNQLLEKSIDPLHDMASGLTRTKEEEHQRQLKMEKNNARTKEELHEGIRELGADGILMGIANWFLNKAIAFHNMLERAIDAIFGKIKFNIGKFHVDLSKWLIDALRFFRTMSIGIYQLFIWPYLDILTWPIRAAIKLYARHKLKKDAEWFVDLAKHFARGSLFYRGGDWLFDKFKDQDVQQTAPQQEQPRDDEPVDESDPVSPTVPVHKLRPQLQVVVSNQEIINKQRMQAAIEGLRNVTIVA
ncbi:MAG: hypothetical protein H7A37_07520 [Chlamydiales bacterium]|nr:hypothetical protein [Chlamydiales bacterium]